MAEYIEREAVIEKLMNLDPPGFEHSIAGKVAIQEILAYPAADVVEVVRCKDCVYWEGRGYDGRCEAPHNGLIRDYSNYDDFCSYGEGKE